MKRIFIALIAFCFLFSTVICHAEFKSKTDSFDGTKTFTSYTKKTLPLKELLLTKTIKNGEVTYILKTSQLSSYGSYRIFNATKPLQIKINETVYELPVIYSAGSLAGVLSCSITTPLPPEIINAIRDTDKLMIRAFLTDRELIWNSKDDVLKEWHQVIDAY